MRTYLVVGVVVAAHCLAVGSAFLIQGCGTIMGTGDDAYVEPVSVVMPPSAEGPPQPSTVLFPPSPQEDVGMPADVASGEMITYVVKKGDSLSRIAVRHGLTVAQVATLNGIRNSNMIRAGQRLLLPSAGAARLAAAPEGSRPKAVVARTGGGGYVVVKGDSLSRIAARHGTTVRALKEVNGLKGDMIRAGQELAIPGGVTRRKAPKPMDPMKPAAPDEPDIKIETHVQPIERRIVEPEVSTEVKPRSIEAAPMRSRIVLEGEDLKTIAQQWGLSVDELKEINNLGDDPIEPGQVLKIPLGEF